MKRRLQHLLRNLAGTLLVIFGVISGFLPILQGWLFIVLGLSLIDHPVKHRLHRRLSHRSKFYRRIAIVYMRAKRRLRRRRFVRSRRRAMEKPAPTDHPIHDLLRRRWSPRALSAETIDDATLAALLEAARWAPSCFNDQPWHFIVARRSEAEEFDRLLACLAPANQAWAQHAAVLVLTVARLRFARNDKPNRHALHDVGLAAAHLTVQATALGLFVHQMAGIDPERCRTAYDIPEHHEPVTAIAVGRPGDLRTLPPDLQEREQAPRSRRPLAEMVFSGRWGRPAPGLGTP